MTSLDLDDIQGYILRGYRMEFARHFILQITDVDAARQFLGALVEHEPAIHAQIVNRQPDQIPQITTAVDWGDTKPDYCVNIGFTCDGLKALQVSTLASFPQEFQEGAAKRAVVVGDQEASNPSNWIGSLGTAQAANAHIVLTLHALSSDMLDRTTATLRDLFKQALNELWCFDAEALEGYQSVPRPANAEHEPKAFPKVHFGYTDGIAQPTITGGPPTRIPDDQPEAPPGEFLLGYESQFSPNGFPVPQPSTLGTNGSFAAFLVLQQDVDGFEQFLAANESATLSKELLASKICGRWRNGVPLVLSPDTDTPDPPITFETIDNFAYATTDPKGFSCPIGAHIRRTNPRDQIIQGSGHTRRIIRRAMPYGSPYDPAHPNDGIERGLVGLFITASIAQQLEFVMQNWVNDSSFAGRSLSGPNGAPTHEILIGNNGSNTGYFQIPNKTAPQNPTIIQGFSSFVTTRGSAYLFLPSITALRYLADSDNFTSSSAAQ